MGTNGKPLQSAKKDPLKRLFQDDSHDPDPGKVWGRPSLVVWKSGVSERWSWRDKRAT